LATDITNWNTAYNWGDHSAAGYLSLPYTGVFGTETVLNLSNNSNVNSTMVLNNPSGWALEVNGVLQANGDVGMSQDLFVTNDVYATNFYGNVDLYNLNQGGATDGQILTWDDATMTWIPEDVGGYVETDPIFGASAASGILSTDITNWNTAYSWGDHAAAGYLTGYTESDPVFGSSAASGILATDITNWNTA
jgi:hypothetical protein